MAMQGNYSRTPTARSRDSQLPADMDLFDEFTAFEGGANRFYRLAVGLGRVIHAREVVDVTEVHDAFRPAGL